MRLQLRPAGEATPGDRVRFDIANTTLVLTLRASAIRRTSANPEAPMVGKCMQPGMQHDLPDDRIMTQDQRLGIVERNLARYAAEGTEHALHAVEPAVLLLMAIGADM